MTASGQIERCDDPFLIIAGMIKGGTTSLHQYLSHHPEICASDPKDPCYFLPPEEPPKTPFRHGRDSLEKYLNLFPGYQSGQVRMEASGTYLPFQGLPEVIDATLPNSRIVFSLRDPIGRLMSYFKMATLWQWLPKDLSFDAYIEEVRRRQGDESVGAEYRQPLDHGLYAERVRRWMDVFGEQRVATVWFDDLEANPATVVSKIAAFAGVDPGFYQGYSFVNVNPARRVLPPGPLARSYYNLHETLRSSLRRGSWLRRALASASRPVKWWLVYNLATELVPTTQASPETIEYLRDYYREDVAALEAVTGTRPPWADEYQ